MAIDDEGEVLSRRKERFGSDNKKFCFFAIEFEKVVVHPGFNISEAVCDGGDNDWGDGFGRDVDLCVVGIAVKAESMVAKDVTEGKHVDDEEEGAKHRTLGNSGGDRGGVRFEVVHRNVVVTVREVGREPGECCAGDAN